MLNQKLKNHNIILASASPRRQEFFKGLGLDFEIRLKPIKEEYPPRLTHFEISNYLAQLKALPFKAELKPKDILITSDTIVWHNNKALGKPRDTTEAFSILKTLSNTTHEVITSVCFTTATSEKTIHNITKVTFKALSDNEINFYIKNYKPFDKDAFTLTFHPYYLKQYNNRWFALGLNEEKQIATWNLALDRILSLTECSNTYLNSTTDWEDHFYDVIGVTRRDDSLVQEVKLLFSQQQSAYISTKPLHASQKSSLNDDGTLLVRLKLILNYELESKLLSFGEGVEVLEPLELRDSVLNRIKLSNENYEK